ncbi:hypothetical protein HOY82DRAFT_372084 [Tuber indicum]|nr:hypothetical protein HOY82DRAFT_372084 [Tuber indicum]
MALIVFVLLWSFIYSFCLNPSTKLAIAGNLFSPEIIIDEMWSRNLLRAPRYRELLWASELALRGWRLGCRKLRGSDCPTSATLSHSEASAEVRGLSQIVSSGSSPRSVSVANFDNREIPQKTCDDTTHRNSIKAASLSQTPHCWQAQEVRGPGQLSETPVSRISARDTSSTGTSDTVPILNPTELPEP